MFSKRKTTSVSVGFRPRVLLLGSCVSTAFTVRIYLCAVRKMIIILYLHFTIILQVLSLSLQVSLVCVVLNVCVFLDGIKYYML